MLATEVANQKHEPVKHDPLQDLADVVRVNFMPLVNDAYSDVIEPLTRPIQIQIQRSKLRDCG